MEILSRNRLFRLTIASILLFPLVPDRFVPYIGTVLGLYYFAYISADRDAMKRFRRARHHILALRFVGIALLFAVYVLLGVLYSADREVTLRGAYLLLTGFLLLFLLKYELNRPIYTKPLYQAYFAATLATGVFFIGQILHAEVVRGVPFDPMLQSSFFASSPMLAYFLLIPVFPALALYIYQESTLDARFYLLVATTAIITVFLSGSRLAVVGLFLGLFLLSLLYSLKFLAALVPTGIFLAVIPFFSARQREFLILSEEFTRLQLFREGLRLFVRNPVFGRGFGTFSAFFEASPLVETPLLNTEFIHVGYNSPLALLMELGVLGFLIASVLALGTLVSTARFIRSKKVPGKIRVLYVGALVSLITLLFLNLADSYVFEPKIVYSLAVLTGLMQGVVQSRSIENT